METTERKKMALVRARKEARAWRQRDGVFEWTRRSGRKQLLAYIASPTEGLFVWWAIGTHSAGTYRRVEDAKSGADHHLRVAGYKVERDVPRIPEGHADDLRWYYEKGATLFAMPSAFGAQLDRAAIYAPNARCCVDCGGNDATGVAGSGFVWDTEEYFLDQAIAGAEKHVDLGAWCAENESAQDRKDGLSGLCKACKGIGWVFDRPRRYEAATVRLTGSSVTKSGGWKPKDISMVRLARVSHRLDRVRARQPAAIDAIESFYAPDGGSIGSLWHLTPSGIRMLRENGRKMPAAAFFNVLTIAQELKHSSKRQKQFDAANEQARDLLEATNTIYCEANL